MNRLSSRLLITVVTFVLGTTATIAWSYFNPLHIGSEMIPPHSNYSIYDPFFSAEMPTARNKTIRQTSQVPKKLTLQLVKDINTNENNFRLSADDMKVIRNNLKCELEDINGDSIPEYFLYIGHSDWCGAGSNCDYWLYQQTRGGYKMLLEDKVLRTRNTITNGYRDLASETPMGFCDIDFKSGIRVQRLSMTLYRYNGIAYEAVLTNDECRPFIPKEPED